MFGVYWVLDFLAEVLWVGGDVARCEWTRSLFHPSTLAISSLVNVGTLSLVHESGILAGAGGVVGMLLTVTGHV